MCMDQLVNFTCRCWILCTTRTFVLEHLVRLYIDAQVLVLDVQRYICSINIKSLTEYITHDGVFDNKSVKVVFFCFFGRNSYFAQLFTLSFITL